MRKVSDATLKNVETLVSGLEAEVEALRAERDELKQRLEHRGNAIAYWVEHYTDLQAKLDRVTTCR